MSEMPAFAKIKNLGLTDTRWTQGYWFDRFNQCASVSIPAMAEIMYQSERYRWLGNFEVSAGLVQAERYRGPKWNDGDFCKWFEGAAAVYAFTKDKKLDELMEQAIAIIGKAQNEDGYIHSPFSVGKQTGKPIERFGNPMDFEMYNMGHLISAACVHHIATGKKNLLEIAIKAADFMDREFANPTPERARHGICPSHLMALIGLDRLLGTKKYTKTAERLLNMRDLVPKGDDDNQDRVPLREHKVAHGHGVRATYLYAGAADVYQELGDKTLLPPLTNVWDDMVSKKIAITGGVGALFDGASPDGTEDQLNITRIHQAFGRNYQLPQSTAHNETCAAIGSIFWNWRMFQITGESKYIDWVESTFYNSVLAGISLDGLKYFYTNTLRQLDPMPVELRFPRDRQASIGCYCCPPNVVRVMAEASTYAYAVSNDALFVTVYGGNELSTTLGNGKQIKLKQETNYPWDGLIKITIQSDAEFAVNLRIPQWAKGASVKVNGESIQAQPGTFAEVRRSWKIGDQIELDLPMKPRLVEASPYVEEALHQIAIVRGPVVYCLESMDLPVDVKLLDIAVPKNIDLKPVAGDGIFKGIVLIEGNIRAYDQASWGSELYRDLALPSTKEIRTRFIPYFAWNNRGKGEMSVWLPWTD